MLSAVERREEIRNFISQKRKTSLDELIAKFGVCRNTVINDLKHLNADHNTCIMLEPGRRGGIKAQDGWYASKHYLSEKQELAIREQMLLMSPEKREIFQSILQDFAMPETNITLCHIHICRTTSKRCRDTFS